MKKILVIDDVTENLIAIKETLEDLMLDCLLLTAQSGKEGLKIARAEQPDTILTDVQMPGMDGFELCKKLKEDEATKHIPVMIFTGSKTDSESRIKCLEAGADVFLTKPIDTGELTAQINVMFRIKEAEDKLRAEREFLDEKVQKRTKELQKANKSLKQDITERRRVEQKLRELDQAIEQTLEGIGIANMDGKFVFVNPAWAEMHGYLAAELIGKPASMLDSPEDRKNFPKVLEEIKKKGFWRGELQRVRKDGSSFPAIMTSSLMTDDMKRQVGIVGVCLDITQRKQAEQALQQSEELYRTMIEHSNDMIWTLDVKGKFLYINKKSEEVVGRSAKSEIGKSFVPLIVEEDLKMVEKVFMETLKGKSQHYEVRIHGNTTTKIITLSVNTAPIKKGGKVIGTVSFGRDITARKKAEEVIQKRMDEIETFNRLAVGREMRMIALKKEINELLTKTGKKPKYKIAE